jgi:hypothetical protein
MANNNKSENLGDLSLLASVFEERAENLNRTELTSWTQETTRSKEILLKLKGPGAKLLSGPRGCGKSTYLRKAYFDLLQAGDTLSVYINYARSLALEPLFHHRANALQIFRQWVLAKVVVGVEESFRALGKEVPEDLCKFAESSLSLIRDLETGSFIELPERLFSPTEILELLECWTRDFGFRRCVLLMDDAAHAFSPEQQREFFEIFRSLRSRVVAAKAAVYPGITSYSAHFHVGHEAELIEAWLPPDDPTYLQHMRAMVQRRLPTEVYSQLENKLELVDYLALASFGLPRGFLNMIYQLISEGNDGPTIKATRLQADAAVKAQVESVRAIFVALKNKLPRFKNFITVGYDVEREIVSALRGFNHSKEQGKKAVVVAISEPIAVELERILSLFEYAGIVRRLDKVSRGIKGIFRRYSLHYAIVMAENALSLGKSYSIDSVNKALTARDAHAFVRVQSDRLLGERFEDRCKIDLPPCQKCRTPRIAEDQRFCMRCGAKLADTSVYSELLGAPVDNLPLTPRKIEDIRKHTFIRTVQDILLDDDMQQIRSIPGIGPVWASRIRNAAEEYVSV